MPCLRSMIAVALVALSVGACTRTDVPEETRRGPRVLGLRGHVLDTARAQPVDESAALQTDARFDIKADAALTILLANGCVVHVVGPTEVSIEALSTLMAEPCTESLDAQVALLGGIQGATVTLRERTAAAGQDQNAFHDTPERGGARVKSAATPSKEADSRSAAEAPLHASENKDAQPQTDTIKSEPDVVLSMEESVTGRKRNAVKPTPPSPPASPPPVVAGQASAAGKAGHAAVSKEQPDTASEPVRLQQNQEPTEGGLQPSVPLELERSTRDPNARPVGLLLRSRALEKLFDDSARASCRAVLVKDGPVAIHAHIENGLIVDVTLANGNPLPCETSLVRQALPFANGVAVARLNPAP